MQSLSRKEYLEDNAFIEYFYSTLKKEEVYQATYVIFEQARISLFHYIGGGYNRKQLHR